MTGRPTKFEAAITDAICERLIEGQSLRSICKAEDMPSASTVCKWLSEHQGFSEQYARAREAQADTLADEIIDIADNGSADVQRDRLAVDARKWYAGKLRPSRYGDKQQLEHSGPDGGAITVQRIERVIIDPANPDSP